MSFFKKPEPVKMIAVEGEVERIALVHENSWSPGGCVLLLEGDPAIYSHVDAQLDSSNMNSGRLIARGQLAVTQPGDRVRFSYLADSDGPRGFYHFKNETIANRGKP